MCLPATLPNLSDLFVKQILVISDVVLAPSAELFLCAAVSSALDLKLIFITELQ